MSNSKAKNQYITWIDELMQECNDLPLLDLIYKLLCKSFGSKPQEGGDGDGE